MEIAIDRIERTMLPGLDRLDSLPLPYWRGFRQAADELAAIAEDLIASVASARPRAMIFSVCCWPFAMKTDQHSPTTKSATRHSRYSERPRDDGQCVDLGLQLAGHPPGVLRRCATGTGWTGSPPGPRRLPM